MGLLWSKNKRFIKARARLFQKGLRSDPDQAQPGLIFLGLDPSLTAIPGSLRSVETDSSGKCTWNYTTTTKAFRFPFNPDNNPVTDHSSDRQRVKQQEILSSLMLRWPKLASWLPLLAIYITTRSCLISLSLSSLPISMYIVL